MRAELRAFNLCVYFKNDWHRGYMVLSLYIAVGDEVRKKGVGEKGREKGIKNTIEDSV